MPQWHLLVARHPLQPGRGVGGAVWLAKPHGQRGADHLAIEVGLRHLLLAAIEGLLEEDARDENFQNIGTMAVEACFPHPLQVDRLAVDKRCHARARHALVGVVHDIFHRGGVLQAAEQFAGGRPALPFANLFQECPTHIGQLHICRWQVPLALDQDELVGHLHHFGDISGGEPEGNRLKPRLAGVSPNRLHPAVGAGAADIDGMLSGQGAKLIRCQQGLCPQADSLLLRSNDEDAGLDGGAELIVVGCQNVFLIRLDAGMGQPAQGHHRPHNLFGILPGGDASLPFDQIDPLVSGNIESPRHGVDFRIDILGRHGHPLPQAGLFDNFFVDERFENSRAVAAEALVSQLLLTDLCAVDHRHQLAGGRGLCLTASNGWLSAAIWHRRKRLGRRGGRVGTATHPNQPHGQH